MKPILLLLMLLLATTHASAEIAFISDDLPIPVHRGSSGQYKIINQLRSGDQVEVLHNNIESGYSLVKFGDNQGWVITTYLSPTPAARHSLIKAQTELEQAKTRLTELQNQLQSSEAARIEAENALNQNRDELEQARQKLDLMHSLAKDASETLHLRQENKVLKDQLETTKAELVLVVKEKLMYWIGLGAGLILLGLLLGLIAPHLRKRRSQWGSL